MTLLRNQTKTFALKNRNLSIPFEILISSIFSVTMLPYKPFDDNYKCPLCHGRHPVRCCARFLTHTPEERYQLIARYQLCSNCLSHSHTLPECHCKARCRRCDLNHHTSLHPIDHNKIWFPMTAYVEIRSSQSDVFGAHRRILIDPRQPHSTITRELAEKLQGTTYNRALVTILPRTGITPRNQVTIECLVDAASLVETPLVELNPSDINGRLSLDDAADPYWHCRFASHLTLGANAAAAVLCGRPTHAINQIMTQSTIFGWTYFGASSAAD